MSDDAATARLRSLIERPEKCIFWGGTYTRTPRLIARVFGDGKLLICITPLVTRPNYFVVRIDSKTKNVQEPAPLDSELVARGGCDVSLLEEIMLAAEEEYGRFGDEEECDQQGDDLRGFPVVDWGFGCTWGKPFPTSKWRPTPLNRIGPVRPAVRIRARGWKWKDSR